MFDKIEMLTSFLSLFSLYLEKKVKSRDSGQFCPAIPGYEKASKNIKP